MSNDAPDISLEMLRRMMQAQGVKQLLVKELAANDNSKNQPYLAAALIFSTFCRWGRYARKQRRPVAVA
jgi:hypothetical protein